MKMRTEDRFLLDTLLVCLATVALIMLANWMGGR